MKILGCCSVCVLVIELTFFSCVCMRVECVCAYTDSPRVPTLGVESGIERENEAHKREKKENNFKKEEFFDSYRAVSPTQPFLLYSFNVFSHTHTLTDIYLILLYHYASFFEKKGFNLCPCAV